MKKTSFVSQSERKEEIMSDVRQALLELGLDESEREVALEAAENSRLVDLQDTIDISKYV